MASTTETFVLIETSIPIQFNEEKIIRTYLTSNRAEQDKELLEGCNPGKAYKVLAVEHIDD